jgi:hypothetical protein
MSRGPLKKKKSSAAGAIVPAGDYGQLVSGISGLLEQARRGAARAVNAILTATYWEIGRRIVEHEQGGKARAEYGEELIPRLAQDLAARFGRGFSERNVWNMKDFYLGWEILQTPSAEFEARAKCSTLSSESQTAGLPTPLAESGIVQTPSAELGFARMGGAFPLSWSHYVRLMAADTPQARLFYESEAIRGGWSVRQLENDPVGLILCSAKDDAVAHYAMGGIKAKVFASRYLTVLPTPETLRQEILTTQHALEARAAAPAGVKASLRRGRSGPGS